MVSVTLSHGSQFQTNGFEYVFSGICVCMDYENELKDLQRPVIKQNSKTQKIQKTAVKTNDYKNKLRSS